MRVHLTMNIKLISTKAVVIELSPFQEETEKENSFSFDFNPVLDEDNENRFGIVFLGEQISSDDNYRCKVIYIAQFESSTPLDSNYLIDPFLLVTAPAIGYPYFRAFYSTILLNAGYNPIILPTINFVKLQESKKDDISSKNNE